MDNEQILALLEKRLKPSRLAHTMGVRDMAVRLARIHGDDAAPHRFSHVRARIDGHHHDGRHPDGGEFQRVIGKIRQAVIEKHGLQHHGRAAEHFHIDADDHPDQPQEEPLHGVGGRAEGDGVEHAAHKADQAAQQRAHQRQHQRIADAAHVRAAVFSP